MSEDRDCKCENSIQTVTRVAGEALSVALALVFLFAIILALVSPLVLARRLYLKGVAKSRVGIDGAGFFTKSAANEMMTGAWLIVAAWIAAAGYAVVCLAQQSP